MATENSTTRCTNEIPATSNPSNCDAVECGAFATYLTEAGPRCAPCYREHGGTLVIEDPEPEFYRPAKPFDFGTAMICAIDQLTKDGVL